jgi:hypothetical protein
VGAAVGASWPQAVSTTLKMTNAIRNLVFFMGKASFFDFVIMIGQMMMKANTRWTGFVLAEWTGERTMEIYVFVGIWLQKKSRPLQVGLVVWGAG